MAGRLREGEDVTGPVCRHCGGLLDTPVSLSGARACLHCGKGTILLCGVELDCGGVCVDPPRHQGAHVCGIEAHHHEYLDRDACNLGLDCGARCALPKSHGEAHICASGVDCPGSRGLLLPACSGSSLR